MSSSKNSISSQESTQQRVHKALSLHKNGFLKEAQEIFADLVEKNKNNSEILHLIGIVFYQIKHLENAVNTIEKAIKLNPKIATFYCNLSVILTDLKRFKESFDAISKAIELNPNNPDYYYNQGNALTGLKFFEEAVASYNKAINLNPNNTNYYYNRANALKECNQFEEIIASYNKSIDLNPNDPTAYCNLANALLEVRKFDLAIKNYHNAILLNPNYVEAYLNLGNAFDKIDESDLAITNYSKAIELNPNYADAYFNRGDLFSRLHKIDLALKDYKKAYEIKADFKFFLRLFNIKTKICDWTNFENEIAEIKNKVKNNEQAVQPFPIITAIDSLEIQFLAAKNFVDSKYIHENSISDYVVLNKSSSSKKIKLAYYSADFHSHATSYLMAGLFELHDRSRFELIAFSFGPESNDEMRRRVEKSFDRFIDVRLKSDNEIVKISREMGVDIAVDLKGFTKDMRLGIFAKRVAPIQVNYLGYPGTMAAGYIDYIIADKVLIPDEERRKYYLEKVVYLPNSYQVNDSKREISSKIYRKRDFSLPEESFIFCCFNNNYKITPQVFDVWMNILKRVSNSVLWLLEDNSIAADNLRREAVKRGVDQSRLVFAKRMQLSEHLARHKLADLFLDTIPCNAHTTCSDALWASLPVLTIAGESFASRVSASLLTAVGLEEMIVDNFVDYEERAVEFATNREKLQLVKEKLQKNRLTMPLFDTKLFTSNLEKAYKTMYDKYQNNLEFDDIIL